MSAWGVRAARGVGCGLGMGMLASGQVLAQATDGQWLEAGQDPLAQLAKWFGVGLLVVIWLVGWIAAHRRHGTLRRPAASPQDPRPGRRGVIQSG